ncbi:hypothetical protein ACFQ38_00335 [Sporosarcina contaminans]|uniref:Head decoration protein n=1 Tax=Sporosarcina contaminans TaxID=633403 RepID=A0ABW3TV75_9BACL
MPYVGKVQKFERVNFLASAKVQAFTTEVSDVGVAAGADGRKIVKAGTVLPANDATAKGILYNDVDVTEGPQPGSLIVEAYILEDRLPAAVDALAKAELTEIKFM